MDTFNRAFANPLRPDPEQLRQTLFALIQAETWAEAKRMVEQHPELLSDEAEELLQHLLAAQADEQAARSLTGYRELLHGCRTEGMEATFARLTQPAQSTTSSESTLNIPAELETEVQELVRLTEQAQRDPELHRQRAVLMESMLRRLRPDQHPAFRAILLINLGYAYWSLPRGDRAANLQQAITCYRAALRFCTPETAPLAYAATQNNLGTAYAALPTGDRAANLRQAIACYREALTVYTPEAAPRDYAMTQYNLGTAYADLPTGDRAANLQQAIPCYHEALRFRTPETAPLAYAATQNNLGTAYANLPTGDRAANLQQAIACYREALTVYTPEAAPRDYAMHPEQPGQRL